MITKLNYVAWIQKNEITLTCEEESKEDFLKELGAKRKLFDKKKWIINCKNENELAQKLQILKDNCFMFAGGSHGWNPADIFVFLREKKLVSGEITEIVWKGPNQTLTRIL